MELRILGSSSAGNCYILDSDKEALIIECGMSFNEVKKALNFNISKIKGVLISHEHGDHARYIKDYIRSHIHVYVSAGTAKSLNLNQESNIHIIDRCHQHKAGNFRFMAFDVQHDAAEPFGYLIYHEEMGTTLFATDTYYLKYKFNYLSNIMIECNYRQDILDQNLSLTKSMRDRTLESHMSYETCLDTLLANDLSKVNNIVLIHLSAANSSAGEFKEGIKKATFKNVHIADKGMTIKFNKTPF